MLPMLIAEWPMIIQNAQLSTELRHSSPFLYQNGILHIEVPTSYYDIHATLIHEHQKQLSDVIFSKKGLQVFSRFHSYQSTYKVQNDWLGQVVDFALSTISNMTQFDFQNSDKKRTTEDFLIDNIEGKLAEFIFREFFRRLTYTDYEIDLQIYQGTTLTDGGNDIQKVYKDGASWLSNIKVDVKSSKDHAQWLLIETTKMLADVYILVKMKFVNEDFLKSLVINKERLKSDSAYKEKLVNSILEKLNGEYSGEVIGFAYLSDIIDPKTKLPWFHFNPGKSLIRAEESEYVITPSALLTNKIIKQFIKKLRIYNLELKAAGNEGIPAKHLRSSKEDWIRLMKQIEAILIPLADQIFLNEFPSSQDQSEDGIKKIYQQKVTNLLRRNL